MSVVEKSAFYYPDIVGPCDARDRASDQESYVVTAPVLIVEVLSRSTEATDLLAYQTLDSLKEYVLVRQSEQRVEVFRRAGAEWETLSLNPGDPVRIESLDFSTSFAEVYEDCDVPVVAS